MINVKLAEKILRELKDNYSDGDMHRVSAFIEREKEEQKSKDVFCSFGDYIAECLQRDELVEMFEMGIGEIEKYLFHGDKLYIKYAYLNFIESYALLKNKMNSDNSGKNSGE